MLLFSILVSLFCFGAIIASAWSVDNPESVREYVGYVASKEGVPVGMTLAIVRAESNFKKDAKNPIGTASGLFQFLDSTFKNYCIKKYRMTDTMKDKNHPFIQTNCAIEMLREKNGWQHWLASYDSWSYAHN